MNHILSNSGDQQALVRLIDLTRLEYEEEVYIKLEQIVNHACNLRDILDNLFKQLPESIHM